MIKEVNEIPVLAKTEKITRTGTVREDVRTALENNVSKFEFIGDIYKRGGQYTTCLNTTLVRDTAFNVVRAYIYNVVKANGGSMDHYSYDAGITYRVYKYPAEPNDRIFMELRWDVINSVIEHYIHNSRVHK